MWYNGDVEECPGDVRVSRGVAKVREHLSEGRIGQPAPSVNDSGAGFCLGREHAADSSFFSFHGRYMEIGLL